MTGSSLVVLAAGRGMRFGGLKQLVAVRDDGATVTDVLVRRAADAGFERAVIVVRPAIEELVRAHLDEMGAAGIPVELAVQRRPRGTADAVLAARDAVDGSFVVVNADDLYPAGAFSLIATHLRDAPAHEHAVVGFRLDRTLVGSRPEARACSRSTRPARSSAVREGQRREGRRLALRDRDVRRAVAWRRDRLDEHVGLPAERVRRARRGRGRARRATTPTSRCTCPTSSRRWSRAARRFASCVGRRVHRHHLPRRRRRRARGAVVIDGGTVQRVAAQFAFAAPVETIAPFGTGHINDTFLVTTRQRRLRRAADQSFGLRRPASAHGERRDRLGASRRPVRARARRGSSGRLDRHGRRRRVARVAPGRRRRGVRRASTPEHAASAAHLLGRFHAGLADLAPTRVPRRSPDFHDPTRRLAAAPRGRRRRPVRPGRTSVAAEIDAGARGGAARRARRRARRAPAPPGRAQRRASSTTSCSAATRPSVSSISTRSCRPRGSGTSATCCAPRRRAPPRTIPTPSAASPIRELCRAILDGYRAGVAPAVQRRHRGRRRARARGRDRHVRAGAALPDRLHHGRRLLPHDPTRSEPRPRPRAARPARVDAGYGRIVTELPELDRSALPAIAELCRRGVPDFAVASTSSTARCSRPSNPRSFAAIPRSASSRPSPASDGAYLRLLVVDPDARGRGHGHALVRAAHADARAAGHTSITDRRRRAVLPVAGRAEHRDRAALPARAPSLPARRDELRHDDRPRDDPRRSRRPRARRRPPIATSSTALMATHWPNWQAEVLRALDKGNLVIARDDAGISAFCAFEVNRAGFLGPVAARPDLIGRGAGTPALVGALHELRAPGPVEHRGRVGRADRPVRRGSAAGSAASTSSTARSCREPAAAAAVRRPRAIACTANTHA